MTNPTIDQLLERRSVRAFTGEHVRDEDLELMLRAAQQAPTSINAQGLSLVVVRDHDTIQKIAELAGGQRQVAGADVFVAFVMDFARTAEASRRGGEEQVLQDSVESLLTGAVDAGLALSAFQTAAHSLGYATCAIGGVRRDPRGMIELLGLPPLTFPVVGSTLGVADPERLPQVKPRVPLETYALPERYDAAAVARGVEEYDGTLRRWWDEQGLDGMATYSDDVARTYRQEFYPDVEPALREQGFLGG